MKWPSFLSALLLCATLSCAAEFYISPTGSDSNPGTLEKPFATLQAARDALRALPNRPPSTIYLRSGLYSIPTTLDFSSKDSALTIRPYQDEKPILIGGRAITNFRLYRGQILQTDVSTQGFKNIPFHQLFFAGQRQHLARYPNFNPDNPYGGGWAYADGKPIPMYANIPGETHHEFQYKPGDIHDFVQPGAAEIFVFARYNWWNNICPIASIDRATRKITLAKDASYPIRPGDRYFIQNVFEELDSPGEWYLNPKTQTLYFWPPAPLENNAVYAPTTRTILRLNQASNVRFLNLTFECSEGDGIILNNCTNCLLAGCTIRNVGDYNGSGIAINGGTNNGVQACDIYQTGSHGIHISGGDRKTLTPANNHADNCYIHHVGVFYKQGVGIVLTGVGNRATHNLIHDGPRMGIMFSGNNLLIEYNHIRHVNLETADTGAVYTGGRDWISSRGTVIRYNYFHDILGFGRGADGKWESPHYSWGVYLDDNAGGVDVIGNIVVRCLRGLVHLHNGRDNLIENNIFIDGTLQQIEYNGWTGTSGMWKEHLPTMIKGYDMVANEPAWKSMRSMDIPPEKAILPSGLIMTGNVFRHNILAWHDPKARLYRFSNLPLDHYESDYNLIFPPTTPPLVSAVPKVNEKQGWDAWKKAGFEQHSLLADPLFVDPAHDNYHLQPNSPAFQLGFKPIPIDQIGPYKSEFRPLFPIPEAQGAREKPLTTH